MAKLMEVICLDRKVGKGVHGNPKRMVTEFWSKEGELLATYDSWEETQKARKLADNLGVQNDRKES